MSWVSSIARPNIAALTAYSSARSITTEGKVFLDANESPDSNFSSFNRYPKPQPDELLQKFSSLYNVATENILMGRGSDEAIDILTRAFCEPLKDKILTTPPTYGMYKVSADIQGAAVAMVPLKLEGDHWKLNTQAIIEQISRDLVKLVYVCSPNNPTGTVFEHQEIRKICEAAAGKSLVVVDEAYIEFTPEQTVVPLLKEFNNLVVLRTLSKAWALAGLRCGVLLANKEIVQLLQKVRAPYPMPTPVVEQAVTLLSSESQTQMQTRVQRITAERMRMAEILSKDPTVDKVYPSGANFLLVKFHDATKVMSATTQAGIVLRSRHSEPGLENCIRITIGSEDENNLLLQVLREGK